MAFAAASVQKSFVMMGQHKRWWRSQPMAAKLRLQRRTVQWVLAHVPFLQREWSRRPLTAEQNVAML
jgi:hypothetical protein